MQRTQKLIKDDYFSLLSAFAMDEKPSVGQVNIVPG